MTPTPAPDGLTGLLPEEIAALLDAKPMTGRQVFQWLHRKRVLDAEQMSNVPKALRARIADSGRLSALTPLEEQLSEKTGTLKVLFQCRDGETLESVLLRQKERLTFCLSSQAGCALRCAFCATGQAGFRRDLSPAEIVEQAIHLARIAQLPEEITPNIVYMGMGEPFLNYEAVVKSIHLLMHPEGMGIGARKITVSTVGDIPGIERFSMEPWQVRLSVSLHAADDELRSTLVPINRRYPLDRLREAIQAYQEQRGRQITIEWTLMEGVNDTESQAKKLAVYLKGLDAVVNVIPWNAVPGLPYATSSPEHQARFMEALERAGVKATLRRERGGDINAACGQLRALRDKE